MLKAFKKEENQVIRMGMANSNMLTPEIVAAYEAPFLDVSYKAGASAWPLLVPIKPDDPGAAMKEKNIMPPIQITKERR